MRLKLEDSTARSLASPAASLVSSCPLAISNDARAASRSGRNALPEAQRPSTAPATVVSAVAAMSEMSRARSVSCSLERENTPT